MIFDRARKARSDAWHNDKPDEVTKTIPVFRGLIQAEPDRYNRNCGQLGYALVRATDAKDGGMAEAKKVIENAIRLRGEDTQTSGTGYYEFNLAIAEILLDENYNAKKKSE